MQLYCAQPGNAWIRKHLEMDATSLIPGTLGSWFESAWLFGC